MKYFCGLDVSLNSTSICVVNHDGDIVREGQAPSEPRAIHEWLSKGQLTMERVGLEAGGRSPWLCHELLSLGYPAICIETRHAKAAMKAQQVKTDRNDARGIAHIMRTGWYREVHVKSHASQKIRVLLNNRKCLLGKRLDIDAQIRRISTLSLLRKARTMLSKIDSTITLASFFVVSTTLRTSSTRSPFVMSVHSRIPWIP